MSFPWVTTRQAARRPQPNVPHRLTRRRGHQDDRPGAPALIRTMPSRSVGRIRSATRHVHDMQLGRCVGGHPIGRHHSSTTGTRCRGFFALEDWDGGKFACCPGLKTPCASSSHDGSDVERGASGTVGSGVAGVAVVIDAIRVGVWRRAGEPDDPADVELAQLGTGLGVEHLYAVEIGYREPIVVGDRQSPQSSLRSRQHAKRLTRSDRRRCRIRRVPRAMKRSPCASHAREHHQKS